MTVFTDSETFHAWADGQPSSLLPSDPWSVRQDGGAAPLRADTTGEVRPAHRAREGDPIGARPGGEPLAVTPPVVRGRGVDFDAQVAVAVADQGHLGHHTPPSDHAMAQLDITARENHTNLPKVAPTGRRASRGTYDPKYRKRLRYERARGVRRIVPAEPVNAHLADLLAGGLMLAAISAASGIPLTTIQRIRDRQPRAVTARTSRALLRLTHASVIEAATGYVPVVGARRRLQGLMAIGWPLATLSERIGADAQGIVANRRTSTLKDVHVSVCRVYDELWSTPGPSAITRSKAATYGYALPLSWDDDEIDNPAAEPHRGTPESGVVGLDLVIELLGDGDTIETVARRLGIDEASIVTAARRKGTPEQKARIAQATDEMREIRLALAS